MNATEALEYVQDTGGQLTTAQIIEMGEEEFVKYFRLFLVALDVDKRDSYLLTIGAFYFDEQIRKSPDASVRAIASRVTREQFAASFVEGLNAASPDDRWERLAKLGRDCFASVQGQTQGINGARR